MKSLYVALWMLVFIVPGIIKSYQWRYTHQILEEHPDWDYKKVLEASENMTNGHKMDLFVLDLSFIGWYLLFGVLNALTLGFANYLLMPYVQQTDAEAYHWLNSLQNPEVLDVEAVATLLKSVVGPKLLVSRNRGVLKFYSGINHILTRTVVLQNCNSSRVVVTLGNRALRS
jgi:hypothetical protein